MTHEDYYACQLIKHNHHPWDEISLESVYGIYKDTYYYALLNLNIAWVQLKSIIKKELQ